jgi:DNA-binding NarL/FixJ family response regulator
MTKGVAQSELKAQSRKGVDDLTAQIHQLLEATRRVRAGVEQVRDVTSELREYLDLARDKREAARVRGDRSRGRSPRRCDDLTRREREILQRLAQGSSNKDVAIALRISVKTVETHRARIMKKIQVHSGAALVSYAIRHRLVEI